MLKSKKNSFLLIFFVKLVNISFHLVKKNNPKTAKEPIPLGFYRPCFFNIE